MQRTPSRISEEEIAETKAFFKALAETRPNVVMQHRIEAEETVGNRKFQLLHNLFEAYVILKRFDPQTRPTTIEAIDEDFNEFLQLLEQCNVLREDAWSTEKRAVYDTLANTDDEHPKSRKQIMDELKEKGIHISDSTLWRIIDELKEFISWHTKERGEFYYYLSRPVQRQYKLWLENDSGAESPEA